MSNEKEKNSSQDSYPFEIRDNCLYVTTISKRGSSTTKVCNFAPRIVSEKTVDDGAVTEKTLVLSGVHADGSTLPKVEVTGADLSNFNWLLDKWGAKCIIEVGQRCKDHLRYFIQTTCDSAEQLTEYHVTGWKKIADKFYYFTDSQYPAGKTEGQMLNGWRTIGGNRYYLGSDGARRTGFQTIDGKKYYFSDYRCSAQVKGVMMKGLRNIAGKYYYFNSNGVMQTGWVTHGGVKEYFGKNGVRFVPLVVLDPGHSSDVAPGTVPLGPGAKEQKAADSLGTRGVETGVYEYELTLTISKKLQKELESRGYKVLLTRTKNTGTYSCVARAEVANKNKADAFIRIHANAYKDPARTGAMTICIKKTNPYCPETYEKSQLLSAKILNTYFKVVGCRREHVWETDTMTGNNWSQVPTTLIEMGYMTNPEEDKLMQTPEYQTKMVQGIADGIDAYFQAVVK